jgi:hypothetical protein
MSARAGAAQEIGSGSVLGRLSPLEGSPNMPGATGSASKAVSVDGAGRSRAGTPVSADGEYEWFEIIRPAHLPRLAELLGGEAGTDLLALLAERYTGAGSYELERILRESGIPVEVFVYS